MSEFVDTSVFIRLLSGDDQTKAARGLALFDRAQRGEVDLFTSESVVAEVVYVLGSPVIYRLPRSDIAAALRPVLSNNGLRLDYRQSILDALDRWEHTRFDFEDCLSVEHMMRQGLDSIYSYDRDFDRVLDVRRLEP